MAEPHVRHRPRSSRYERIGTLSLERIVVPHSGHADEGATTDTFRGTRSITTVRNEPKTRPNSPNAAIRNAAIDGRLRRGGDAIWSSTLPWSARSHWRSHGG